VALRGYCEKPGFARIGFGECVGEIVPALDVPAGDVPSLAIERASRQQLPADER
jgi:hypothetical protein